jgi:glycosyltransferase involved in cell wall biosynthesis
MKISLVIPYYEVDESKKVVLQACLNSLKGQYDELIIISDKISNLSRKINKGLLLSTGDYIVVCNDDIILEKGTLKDTCLENYVVSPYVNGGVEKLFHAHMWTIPRKVLAEVGLMSEDYEGFYYDDSDYWMQIESKGFQIKQLENVDIIHSHPARTLSKLGKPGLTDYNKDLFIKTWGLENYLIIIKLT